MEIFVEFYGIPRQRAGVDRIELQLQLQTEPLHLGRVLEELGTRFPRLADDCLSGGRLQHSCTVSVNGERFVTAAETPLQTGDTLLIMSADAGG